MLMEIIAFTLATMTQDSIFCDEGDSEMFKKARTSIFGKVINNIFRFTNCNVLFSYNSKKQTNSITLNIFKVP